MPSVQKFQTASMEHPNRLDHVWVQRDGPGWLCCLCGATAMLPPPYPTSPEWMPTSYEKLTEYERQLCPLAHGRKLL
jgi:hypothetical protein